MLLPGELALWRRLGGPDRRHAVGVARAVAEAVPDAPRPVLAAALLHDVGKLDSGLGTFARVPATLVGIVAGRDRGATWRGRVGAYLDHPARGAAHLRAAGSDPLTVTWAEEHHLPHTSWSLPAPIAAALAAADDD
ncbi:MAG TPA: hypothetical protein VFA83_12025 [Acidimicrobiales bacterium]|nr:hypothetical protein [Acidimicrobiales bacterium]